MPIPVERACSPMFVIVTNAQTQRLFWLVRTKTFSFFLARGTLVRLKFLRCKHLQVDRLLVLHNRLIYMVFSVVSAWEEISSVRE